LIDGDNAVGHAVYEALELFVFEGRPAPAWTGGKDAVNHKLHCTAFSFATRLIYTVGMKRPSTNTKIVLALVGVFVIIVAGIAYLVVRQYHYQENVLHGSPASSQY
jgi:hypothetical protein